MHPARTNLTSSSPPSDPMQARDLVTARVAARAKRFPHFDLSPLDTNTLDRRDAALAHAIDQAVARRWLTLVTVLQSQLSRPWDHLQPQVQAALLTGAAQLLLLDRLPDHAVIHEAVQWTKTNVAAKASGLVNAVLRRVANLRDRIVDDQGETRFLIPRPPEDLPLHDGRAWRLKEPIFADDPLCRLGQQTSHPPELLARWVQRFGQERTGQLAAHSLIHPPILVAGLPDEAEKSARVDTTARDASSPPQCESHEEQGFAVFDGDRTALEELLRNFSNARVQDPSSARAVRSTAHLAPNLIIEVCAGRGTKTRQLAELHPQACIVATDIKPPKLAALQEVFKSHTQVRVVEHGQLIEFAGHAELVVVDVPCSNTAVLARRVEAKYRFSRRSLAQLVKLQRQIIADSIRLLTGTGQLLYSTCSLEPQENEQQVEWIARWHQLRVRGQEQRLPRSLPGDPPSWYADGSYFALLGNSAW